MPGGWEWLIIVAVLLLLFGAKRLPDMARSVGQSARVFKGEMKGMKADDESAKPDAPADPPAAAPPAALPPAQATPQEPDRAAQQGHSSAGQ
jgi:sec-independent protein translocase protein TatA